MRQGGAFDEHVACGSAHRRRPPGPPSTWAGNFSLFVNFGGLSFDFAFFSSRPTGAFCHQNLKAFLLYRTPPGACLPVRCGGGRAGRQRAPITDQLPRFCQGRRCNSSAHFHQILYRAGACAPEARRTQSLVLASAGRNCQENWRASPVKWGSGGKPPMSARSAKALIEGGPQRFFGDFLIAQKVTSPPHPQGGTPNFYN